MDFLPIVELMPCCCRTWRRSWVWGVHRTTGATMPKLTGACPTQRGSPQTSSFVGRRSDFLLEYLVLSKRFYTYR